MDKNQITLIGNLGDDPKHFDDHPDKTEFATFSVATTLQFRATNGETMEDTEWHRVVAFGWRADVARHFHKGERVFVEGYVRTRKYETKDGEAQAKEIVAQLLYPVRAIPGDARRRIQRLIHPTIYYPFISKESPIWVLPS